MLNYRREHEEHLRLSTSHSPPTPQSINAELVPELFFTIYTLLLTY